MFGKAEWFQPKAVGWGLRPIVWQGWLYSTAWMAVVGAPFISLILRQQVAEGVIWLIASMGMLSWEVRGMRRELASREVKGVLYIHDDGSCQRLAMAKVAQAGK